MMKNELSNKIEADSINIGDLLKDQKFSIDYFQREYRWQERHIKSLIDDLISTFLNSHQAGNEREAVTGYQNYYLGPVIFNARDGKSSIIDGQQRITSITLLLIYLNHLQHGSEQEVNIGNLIFSEKYGKKSFNMTDETRKSCLNALFNEGEYEPNESDDETVRNMVDRYRNITESFPYLKEEGEEDGLRKEALPYFIDWLLDCVILVRIVAHSEERAYMIFETMNDRGLNLTSSEMLKAFVLSQVTDPDERGEIDGIWKKQMQELRKHGEHVDQAFFHAWFRAKYAESMRPSKVGAENRDFELIGSRFHVWFKNNYKTLFKLESSDSFYQFFRHQFPFYVEWYLKSREAQSEYECDMPHLHFIKHWGIAESLQDALLLASINYGDKPKTIKAKLDSVARYIETFTVRRATNFKKFGQASIKDAMFRRIKLIRDKDLVDIHRLLANEIENIDQKWDKVTDFHKHGQNKGFVKHLLSRIYGYLDKLTGKPLTYADYHHPQGKPFEVEHIWGDKFEEHMDEFAQKDDFQKWRNSIGALLLLPNGTNQSFTSDKYEDKLKHYLKGNTYEQTLHSANYEKNPNFTKNQKIKDLGFKPHAEFKKKDIQERAELVKRICEQIWSVDYFATDDKK